MVNLSNLINQLKAVISLQAFFLTYVCAVSTFLVRQISDTRAWQTKRELEHFCENAKVRRLKNLGPNWTLTIIVWFRQEALSLKPILSMSEETLVWFKNKKP